MQKNRILGGIAAAALSISAVTLVAAPAEATVGGYCKSHHQLWGSEYSHKVSPYVDTAPDPIKTSGILGYTDGYLLCNVPGRGRWFSNRYIAICYTHTGSVPSFVLRGVSTDYLSKRTVGGVAEKVNEVNDIWLGTHPRVQQGDSFCVYKWFKSNRWVRQSQLLRWHVVSTLNNAAQKDQKYSSSWRYIDPANDHMITPFRK